jgi:HK97 family phage portal protein
VGLGSLLTRSSPNVAPASLAPSAAAGATFMPGPEQTWPPSSVLPPASESSALSVPAFWRGCAYVCGAIGMLPVTAYRDTDALDPQPAVIRQPDPNQTPMAFWTGVGESLTLYGNSICIVTSRDRLGYPLTLKPIHPTLAAVRFTGNPMAPTIDAWYVAGQMYDPTDVWHVKSHLGRAGWPLGRGLIDTDADAIAMALALQGYAASYFNGGGMPAGVLKIHRPEITQDQADTAKANWVSKFAGKATIAVLNELTDFTPVSWNPVDSQMIESRQLSLIDIANMWNLPGGKVNAPVGGGTYRNAEMEEVQARNDGVAPWTQLLEQAVSLELLPSTQHVQWDLGAALRTDTLSQYQAYQMALGGPGPSSQWLLVDEVRAHQNLDPMADVAEELGVESPTTPDPPPAPPTSPSVAVMPIPPEVAPTDPAANQHPDGTPVPLTNGKG